MNTPEHQPIRKQLSKEEQRAWIVKIREGLNKELKK